MEQKCVPDRSDNRKQGGPAHRTLWYNAIERHSVWFATLTQTACQCMKGRTIKPFVWPDLWRQENGGCLNNRVVSTVSRRRTSSKIIAVTFPRSISCRMKFDTLKVIRPFCRPKFWSCVNLIISNRMITKNFSGSEKVRNWFLAPQPY